MRIILSIGCLFLCACSTTVRDKQGVTRFRTFADLKDFHYKDESTEITASIVDHSTPTRAGTTGVADGLTAAAAAGLIGVK
jgi:hypothetical protein